MLSQNGYELLFYYEKMRINKGHGCYRAISSLTGHPATPIAPQDILLSILIIDATRGNPRAAP
jgi:hypothetical protein